MADLLGAGCPGGILNKSNRILVGMISGIWITSNPSRLLTFEALSTISLSGLPSSRERSGIFKNRKILFASGSFLASRFFIISASSGDLISILDMPFYYNKRLVPFNKFI